MADTRESIEIRRYASEDLEEVVAVWRASKRAAFPYVEAQQRYTLEQDTEHFAEVIARECEVWVAWRGGRVAGLLAQRGDLVHQLFVRVDLQRTGVGSALLARAKARSPSGLRLYTFQRNAPARRFYARAGLREVGYGTSPPPENEPDVEFHWLPPPPESGGSVER